MYFLYSVELVRHFLPCVPSFSAKNFYNELFNYILDTQLKNDRNNIKI